MRRSLKGQNQGASLLAVLVALVIVGIIAVVITNLTIVNIQMREVEKTGKQNFYSAESVMDDVSARLNEQTAESMRDSYSQVLTEYSSYLQSGEDPQKKFEELYVDKLIEKFQITPDATQIGQRGKVLRGSYDVAKVANMLDSSRIYDPASGKLILSDPAADYESYFKGADAAKAQFEANYVDGLFVLKGIQVGYVEDGYETTVSADLVFHAPELHYKGYKNFGNFMLYSLIAEYGVKVTAPNIKVGGNVYAGADIDSTTNHESGILAFSNGEAEFTGDMIITRGSVKTNPGCTLTLGNGTGQIWAENIETFKGGASTIELKGSTYVSDDLALNGDGSTVKISGNYFGYNFQKNYAVPELAKSAQHSSAIMVNGRNCTLDMSGILPDAKKDNGHLWIAGRSYISRGSSTAVEGAASANSDIMLGESVSARSSQLACYVPDQYLDLTAAPVRFSEKGRTDYSGNLGIADVTVYLDAAKQVTPYYYRSNGVTRCRYYLNFKDEQAANDFYKVYYEKNGMNAAGTAGLYLSNLKLGDGMLYALSGDFLYESPKDASESTKITIAPTNANYAKGDPMWSFAERMAKKYKTLQTSLDESGMGVASDDVRIEGDADGKPDKRVKDTVYEGLVSRRVLGEQTSGANDGAARCKILASAHGTEKIWIVDNNHPGASDNYVFQVNSGMSGIVIATGDVRVNTSFGTPFRGLIITDGSVYFSDGAVVEADEQLVYDLIKEHASVMLDLFKKAYLFIDTAVEGDVQPDQYLTYDNWRKNEE